MARKDATADVGVGVRRRVVVDVERPVVLVLVIVTAMVQARVGSVKVPVIRDIVCCTVDPIGKIWGGGTFQRPPLVFFGVKYSILNFVGGNAGEGTAVPSPLHPYLHRGCHAAFGGRSWRRQPMSVPAFDVVS